jgi:hypothetical protein
MLTAGRAGHRGSRTLACVLCWAAASALVRNSCRQQTIRAVFPNRNFLCCELGDTQRRIGTTLAMIDSRLRARTLTRYGERSGAFLCSNCAGSSQDH